VAGIYSRNHDFIRAYSIAEGQNILRN